MRLLMLRTRKGNKEAHAQDGMEGGLLSWRWRQHDDGDAVKSERYIEEGAKACEAELIELIRERRKREPLQFICMWKKKSGKRKAEKRRKEEKRKKEKRKKKKGKRKKEMYLVCDGPFPAV